MSFLDRVLLQAPTLVYALNVALASVVVAGLGWLAARWARRLEAPLVHSLLLTTVLLLAVIPVLVACQGPWALGAMTLSLASQPTGDPSQSSLVPLHDTHDAAVVTHAAPAVGTPSGPPTRSGGANHPSALSTMDVGRTLGSGLVLAWFIGVVVRCGSVVRASQITRTFRSTLDEPQDARLSQAVRRASQNVGHRGAVPVLVSRWTPCPMTLGLVRPVIVLPEYLTHESERHQLDLVLLHELAHVARGDRWVAALQRCTSIIYWWNPILRRLHRQLSHVRELLCDDHVIAAGGDGRHFARTLLSVAERTTVAKHAATALMDNDAGSLENRIRRLLRPASRATRMDSSGWTLTLAFAALLLILTLTARVIAQPDQFGFTFRLETQQGTPAAQVPVATVSRGYPGEQATSTFFLSSSDGVISTSVSLADLGRLAFVAHPDSEQPTIIDPDRIIDATRLRPSSPGWLRHVGPADRSGLEIRAQVAARDGRETLNVTITNQTGFDLVLSDTDLCLVSEGWRVFPPYSEQRWQMNVRGRGGSATLVLDWRQYVHYGLWYRHQRAPPRSIAIIEPTAKSLDVRVQIAGVFSANSVAVTHPTSLLSSSRPDRTEHGTPIEPRPGLAGVWTLSLPAGFRHEVQLVAIGPDRYRLLPEWFNMSGIYDVQDAGRRLFLAEPNDSRLTGFQWQVESDDRIKLAAQPVAAMTGANYDGATLLRREYPMDDIDLHAAAAKR